MEPGTVQPEVVSGWERAIGALLEESRVAAPYQLPALVGRHAASIGATEAVVYLVDLQQVSLVPFVGSDHLQHHEHIEPLAVDSTVAGRCFQRLEVLEQPAPTGVRVWLPQVDGAERLGVLGVTLAAGSPPPGGTDRVRLARFAGLVAELLVTKTFYGDAIVSTRRRGRMGLAAEMQWGLLPPLTFAGKGFVLAGVLEPAYEVAGDSLDYAVDEGVARFALVDGMGHGLGSAQLAVLVVSAYRHARRQGRSLLATAALLDATLTEAHAGDAFATAVLAELDPGTGVLSWVNAGHPEPLLIRDGRLVRHLHVDPGLPLGLGALADVPYTVGTEQLQPGDRVVLYTDGVIEAPSPGGDRFGEDRLVDLLVKNLAGGLSAPETMRRVVRALLAHQQGQLDDDATLLLLEWGATGEKATLPPDSTA